MTREEDEFEIWYDCQWEAIWGIPEQMKSEAMRYLPDAMVAIVEQFHNRKQNLRK